MTSGSRSTFVPSYTETYGVTADGRTGWSRIEKEPNMSTLLEQRQVEMWANTHIPYFCSYAPGGVALYPEDQYLPWKRREYRVAPPTFEGTRFRADKQLIGTLRQSWQGSTRK